MRRDRLVILVVLALVAIAVPAGAQGRPVMVYGVIHEYTLARLMQLYERQAGGKADFIRLSAGEVATRVQAERQAPKGDVIFGISRAIAESMKAQGLLEPYKTPRRADVPSRYADPDGHWTGSSLTVQGVAINSERWNKERFFQDFLLHYTNAPFLVGEQFQDTEDLDGVFSGLMQYKQKVSEWPYDAFVGEYSGESWQYAGTGTKTQGWQAATARSGEQNVGKEGQGQDRGAGPAGAGGAAAKEDEARKAGAYDHDSGVGCNSGHRLSTLGRGVEAQAAQGYPRPRPVTVSSRIGYKRLRHESRVPRFRDRQLG